MENAQTIQLKIQSYWNEMDNSDDKYRRDWLLEQIELLLNDLEFIKQKKEKIQKEEKIQ